MRTPIECPSPLLVRGWAASRWGTPGVLLLAIAMAAMLPLAGCGGYDKPAEQVAEPEEPPAPPPPPEPKPISLANLTQVTLDPGAMVSVPLTLERNENKGAITIAVDGVPEGITAKAAEIPDGESSGKLEIAAAESLGAKELLAKLQVTAKLGELQAENSIVVTVNKLNLPSFTSVPEVILQPGATATVSLSLNRNEFEGPLELRVESAPASITGKVENVAAGASTAKLEITAGATAAAPTKPVRVTGTLLGRSISVDVPLKVDRDPFLVKAFKVIALKPGEIKPVEVNIERRSFKGPIELTVADLPEGVSAPAVQVPPNQTKATVELTAIAGARERVRSANVVGTGGDITRSAPLVVRVTFGESGFLPREITADPELFPLLRRGSFGGRLTTGSKKALLDAYGGTEESEAAVLKGLEWLAAHQELDGRWSLKNYGSDLPDCDCRIDAEKEAVDYDTAGTAFGLLAFLGAGVAQNRSPEDPPELARYKKNVFAAVRFLSKNQVKSNDKSDGNLGGNLYSHALGAMALCEAYGLSGEESLKIPAQLAIKYIAESQHSEGGWRYSPRTPGDLSATGWMFLAIHSGELAGMRMKSDPLRRAERFVGSCASGPDEAKYSRFSYTPAGDPKLSVSAAGLLTRQYLGWSRDEPDLVVGVDYLMKNLPPASGDKLGHIYYYYYATQVLHHMEGPDFDLWNYRMREHLIRTQEKEGHAAGSWSPEGTTWGKKGGRLYTTSLAIMTLQVYYRHLPLYRPLKRTGG